MCRLVWKWTNKILKGAVLPRKPTKIKWNWDAVALSRLLGQVDSFYTFDYLELLNRQMEMRLLSADDCDTTIDCKRKWGEYFCHLYIFIFFFSKYQLTWADCSLLLFLVSLSRQKCRSVQEKDLRTIGIS